MIDMATKYHDCKKSNDLTLEKDNRFQT